jgi:hypothetical protein
VHTLRKSLMNELYKITSPFAYEESESQRAKWDSLKMIIANYKVVVGKNIGCRVRLNQNLKFKSTIYQIM